MPVRRRHRSVVSAVIGIALLVLMSAIVEVLERSGPQMPFNEAGWMAGWTADTPGYRAAR